MRANRSLTDVLGLRHSLLGYCAGCVGLLFAVMMMWWPDSARILAVAGAALLLGFAIDTAVQTTRVSRADRVGGLHGTEHAARPASGTVLVPMDWAKWAGMTGFMVLFAVAGATLALQQGSGSVVAWVAAGVCGLGALIGVFFGLMGRRTFVRVDDLGVLESTRPPHPPSFVRWDDLVSVETTGNTQRTVGLLLRVRGRTEPVFVATTFLKGGADAALGAIKGHPGYPPHSRS